MGSLFKLRSVITFNDIQRGCYNFMHIEKNILVNQSRTLLQECTGYQKYDLGRSKIDNICLFEK